jgi:serine/threonine-protein kinase
VPNSQAAYDLYLKGKYFFNQRGEGLNKGLEYFRQSIALDSTFAQAYATIALTYSIMTYYNMLPAHDGLREGKKYARKAIDLDPGSSDAYTALGFMELHLERNWARAKEYLDQAVALNPNNSLAVSQTGNYFQWIEGDYPSAIARYEKAIDLDPLYFVAYANLAGAHIALDQTEKAFEYCQKGLELNSTSVVAITQLANVLWTLNRREQAIESLIRGLTATNRHQGVVALLCEGYADLGQKQEAMALYTEIQERTKTEYIAPFTLGRVAVAVGKVDEGLRWFEKAFEEKNPGFSYMRLDPDPL